MSVLTRIRNNQITDSTITGSKLASRTITSGLLENNLTYGSNLTVSGNLTVNGTTTTVDVTNTLIADPLLVLSRGETGVPSADSGFVVERGTSTNVAFIWDESEDEFALINTTEDGSTAGDVAISSYANVHVGTLTGNSTAFGNINITGNSITSTNTDGDVSIIPNGAGAVNLSADTVFVGDINSDATVTTDGTGDLILNTNNGTNSGSITIADGVDGNISLSPNGSGEVVLATLAVSDLTSGRVLLAGTSGAVEDSTNLTFDGTTLAVTGNVTVDNVTVDGNTVSTSAGNLSLDSAGGEVTVSSLAITDLTSGRVPYVTTGDAITDSADLTFDGTTLAVTGNVAVDNVTVDGNTVSTSAGNLSLDSTGGEVTASSLAVTDLTSGRVLLAGTSGAVEDSANLTFDGTTLAVTGNVTIDNITIDGDTISSAHTTITIDPSTAGAGGTVVIAGNLQVTGTTTTVESTVVTIDDPVFQIGETTDDNLDRGIKALYSNDGSTAQLAFFGMDNTNQEFVYIPDATDTSSVFSGSLGGAAFGSLRVTDLTDNRVLIAGASGEVEDDANLTFDGTDLTASSLKVSDLTNNRVLLAGTSGAVEDSADLTFDGTTLTVTGNVAVDNVTIDGNTVSTSAGNLSLDSTGGEVTATSLAVSDLTSGRVLLAGTSGAVEDNTNLTFDGTTLAVTGNVAVDNVTVDGNTVSTSAGNLSLDSTGGEVTATSLAVSDLTSTRLVFAGSSGALEDSANLTFSSNSLSVTGNVAVDNITLDGNSITSSDALTLDAAANQSIVVNEAGADVDVRIEASGEANAIFVEGSTGNVGFKTATPNADAILTLNSTDSVVLPVGTTIQRPGTPATGMFRFNTTLGDLEFYDGAEWKPASSVFTVIEVDDFTGDGSTTVFTLGDTSTSASTLIAINGIVQDPGTAYSISGTTLTFTEAPAVNDLIDVRRLTTTTVVTAIEDLDTSIEVDNTAETATTTINGNVVMTVTNAAVVPGANLTYDLGSSSLRWRDLYLSGSSITLGDLVLKDNGSNVFGLFQSDGTTPATLSSSSIAANSVALGTDTTGNYVATIAGTTNEIEVSGSGSENASVTIGLPNDVTIGNDLTVTGNLTVNGTTTTVSTTNTVVSDSLLELNNGAASNANDLGIIMERGSTGDNAFMGWDESADKFIMGTTTATGASTGNLTISTGTLVANLEGNVTGTASTATEATNVTVTANNTANETVYLTFVDGATGAQGIETDTNLTYNPSTNVLSTTASQAQYADLAELYAADQHIEPGTVVCFGGDAEVTVCEHDSDRRVAGVVSTDPAYLMNSGLEAEHTVALALQGRVPCRVVGPVRKGDMMVSAGNGMARAEFNPIMGSVIGKAVQSHAGGKGVIEIAVGRL